MKRPWQNVLSVTERFPPIERMMNVKRLLLLLLCLCLPLTALADVVASADIPVYQIEPANGLLYTDGVLPAGTAYSVVSHVFPEPGTELADFFITSGPIEWGRVVASDGSRTGLIVLNPSVILGERVYTEAEAAEAEARHAAYGDAYPFVPLEAAQPLESALVLCESLTLRAQPDTMAEARATLPYGTTVTCTGAWHPGWLEVSANGQTGWVREALVQRSPAYLTLAAETPVLAWPSPEAPWVGLLDAGTSVPVLGVCDGYTVISLRGASGFVAK